MNSEEKAGENEFATEGENQNVEQEQVEQATETQDLIGDGDGDANGNLPANVKGNGEDAESSPNPCLLHCRLLWASACTGICCCCPVKDDTDGQVQTNENLLDKKRQSVTCTDIPTLVIFLIFLLVSVIVSILGIVKGNPLRLYYGYDSFGNTCGAGNGSHIFDNKKLANYSLSGLDMSDKKYVFFMNAMFPFSSMKLCVQECPTGDSGSAADIAVGLPCTEHLGCGLRDYYNRKKVKLCRYDIDPKYYFKENNGVSGPCPTYPVMGSSSLMHRCIPELGQTIVRKIGQFIVSSITESEFFQALFRSVVGNAAPLTLLFLAAVLMAFLIVVLIYIITSVIFWILLGIASVGMITGTSVLWYQYDLYKRGNGTNHVLPILELEYASEKAFLAYGIIATALTVIFFVLIAVTFNKIKVVIKVFHRAGRILIGSPSMFIVPALTVLFLFFFCLIWSVCLVSLVTAGDSHVNATSGFVYREADKSLRGAWWFHVFCFLWFSQFILDCQNIVVSSVVVNNFFRPDNRCIAFPVTRAICTLLRHHLGSVAFGSLFITLWRIPKYLLRIIKVKVPDLKEPFQMNRNGYAMVAIERDCFFNSANKAEALLLTNSLQVRALPIYPLNMPSPHI